MGRSMYSATGIERIPCDSIPQDKQPGALSRWYHIEIFTIG
jgi:hypothetical protein